MTIKTLISTIILTSLLLIAGALQVRAQEATASADPVTQTLKDRVQKVLQQEDGKVAGATSQDRTSFGLIGTLQKVVGSTLQVLTYQGSNRVVELDKSATIVRAGKSIKPDEIELNSPVTITGVIDQDETYHVRRLTALADPVTQSNRATILGNILSLTTKAFTFAVEAGSTESQLTIGTTTKTSYFDILGERIDRKQLKVNQPTVFVIPGDLTATSSAIRVYAMTPITSATASALLKQ